MTKHYKIYRLRKDTSLGTLSGALVKVNDTKIPTQVAGVDDVPRYYHIAQLVNESQYWPEVHIGYEYPHPFVGAKLLTNSRRKVYQCGSMAWYLIGTYNKVLHRTDGPAYEWDDGGRDWYINGDFITSYAQLKQLGNITDDDMIMLKLKYGEFI
jgi:hypothetical protein